ncbi:CD82 antigen isoform X2 [Marmota marmota marmota]|uniref:CD82 antigen isoform X2 n=1 Tax=Marmota marmota marmota TaxID=9994 RepID=UPI00076229CE|nr:CD82 antigen isoform X2 [Marmota marmota marmota]XP_015333296.1 CD82 antigen isoform X2 [Marmota marmota marmota]XP_048644603.1 CD82 antigen isoform X2 [Marmota marmota marmota]
MGAACIKVTKYFLFLFNLLFFILGAVILGFGVWILADRSSFISVLQTSSGFLKTGAFVFVGVGVVTMLMGFLGCLGAVNEVRCLLGLYFAFLLLILVAQVAAGTLFYFNVGQVSARPHGLQVPRALVPGWVDGRPSGVKTNPGLGLRGCAAPHPGLTHRQQNRDSKETRGPRC